MDLGKVWQSFNNKGYAVLPNFLDNQEIDMLLKESKLLLESIDFNQPKFVFKTGNELISNEYFINSSDKISFFFEDQALDKSGNLIVEKDNCLNKIGHALHWLNPIFKKITFSSKVKNIVRAINFQDPHVVQSMLIFKNPKIGGKVVAHQDATFLYTQPQIKLVGIWIALDDVTLENGCLWFIPGSHNKPIETRMIRSLSKQNLFEFTRPFPKYDSDQFFPVLVSKGSCILIDGRVVHKSEPNLSNNPRRAYIFHIFDKKYAQWSLENWLQPISFPFPSLNAN